MSGRRHPRVRRSRVRPACDPSPVARRRDRPDLRHPARISPDRAGRVGAGRRVVRHHRHRRAIRVPDPPPHLRAPERPARPLQLRRRRRTRRGNALPSRRSPICLRARVLLRQPRRLPALRSRLQRRRHRPLGASGRSAGERRVGRRRSSPGGHARPRRRIAAVARTRTRERNHQHAGRVGAGGATADRLAGRRHGHRAPAAGAASSSPDAFLGPGDLANFLARVAPVLRADLGRDREHRHERRVRCWSYAALPQHLPGDRR